MSASLKVHTLKSHYVYFYNTTHKSFSYTSASVSRCSRCSLLGPLHWLPLILSGVLLLQLLRPFPHRLRLDPGSHPGVKRTGHQRVTWRAGCCRCELEPPHSQRSDWMWCHDLRRHLQNGEKKGGTNRSWILWTASETPSTFCWRRMFSWFYTAVSGITQDSSNVDSHLTVLRLNIKESWKPMWPYNHFVSALSIMS